MNRTPSKILNDRLGALQTRERMLRLFWGASQVIAVALIALGFACWADYAIDRWQDTPFPLRIAMTVVQGLLLLWLLNRVLIGPLRRTPTLDRLAADVEAARPQYGHRLVSALQLNRPEALTRGMSDAMIDDLTQEAEKLADQESFTPLADHRRMKWGIVLALPVILIAAIAFVLRPQLVSVLVQRQALLPIDIPRQWMLANETPAVAPSGEELTVRIISESPRIDAELRGVVRVQPEGQPADRYPLEWVSTIDETHAVYEAQLPKSSLPLTFQAWLGDGRMKSPAEVVFEPRPVVTRIDAWSRLPKFVGLRPDKSLFEEAQALGEVNGYKGGTARVRIEASRPLKSATLVLYGRAPNQEVEQPFERVPMTLDTTTAAEAVFTVTPKVTGYRVEVVDTNGFENRNPPRRNVAVVPDESPYVVFLPEQFPGEEGESSDAEVEGIPVPLGKTIRIAYYARSPLGLARARLAYRINEGKWDYFPLSEVAAAANVGTFDLRRGVFEQTGFLDQVEFFTVPSPAPWQQPSGLEGGGRFDFQTKTLRKKSMDGRDIELAIGDRIEFAVEVFDRDPTSGREPGRSESRLKVVVDLKGFFAWMDTVVQNESKLRRLREKQQEVFDQSK